MELKHYTLQTKLTDYFPIPRSLLSLELNSTALLLYGVLLDRATLSRKNDYTDASGWVYVVYTQEELAGLLCISTRMIKRYLQQLEKLGLLRRYRSSRKYANQYFLCLPSDSVMGTGTGQECPPDGTDPARYRGHQVPGNNRKKQPDMINTYQHDEEESL